MKQRKHVALILALVAVPFGACDGCDEIGNLSSLGSLEPATFDFGPVVTGEQCIAELTLRNDGQADLAVNGSEFVDKNGDFGIDGIVPAFVGAFSSDVVRVAYVAGTPGAGAEAATLQLATNTPENDGVIRAALRGVPVASASAAVATSCEISGETLAPCNELNFGTTIVASTSPGVVRTLRVTNDGTSSMLVVQPAITNNFDFSIDGARVPSADGLGGSVEINDGDWPVELQPAKGQCGVASDNTVTYIDISVRYTPSEIGADAGTLRIDTDALIDPSGFDISLIGLGSGDGIGLDPEFVQFGEVPVGQEKTESVRVFNMRLDEARVNNSCLDTDRDDVCDIDCTAVDSSAVLSCGVEKLDGSHEGKGFVLDPVDAAAGGNDERVIKIRWAPDSASALRAQLLLETSMGGGRTWKALVNGGVAGHLSPSSDPVHLAASGDPLSGQVSFTISNSGQAPLTISQVTFNGSESITSEFTLTSPADSGFSVNGTNAWTGSLSIGIGASETFDLDYQNGAVVNCDSFDIYWFHDGDGQNPYILGVEVDGDNCP